MGRVSVSGSRRSSSARRNPPPSVEPGVQDDPVGGRTSRLRLAQAPSVSAASSYPASRRVSSIRRCSSGVALDDQEVRRHGRSGVYRAGPTGGQLSRAWLRMRGVSMAIRRDEGEARQRQGDATGAGRDRAGGRQGDAHELGRAKVLHSSWGRPWSPTRSSAPARSAPTRWWRCWATSARTSRKRWWPATARRRSRWSSRPSSGGPATRCRLGLEPLAARGRELVLILYGDAPLLRRETIEALVAEARRDRRPGDADRGAARSHRLRADPARPARGGCCGWSSRRTHPGRAASSTRSTPASTPGPPSSCARPPPRCSPTTPRASTT